MPTWIPIAIGAVALYFIAKKSSNPTTTSTNVSQQTPIQVNKPINTGVASTGNTSSQSSSPAWVPGVLSGLTGAIKSLGNTNTVSSDSTSPDKSWNTTDTSSSDTSSSDTSLSDTTGDGTTAGALAVTTFHRKVNNNSAWIIERNGKFYLVKIHGK